MKQKIFNNSELNNSIKDVYDTIKETQYNESWKDGVVSPCKITISSYDNGFDKSGNNLSGYAIDINDNHNSFLYSNREDAEHDFDLLTKKWDNKKIYAIFFNSLDEETYKTVVRGHIRNKGVLVHLAIHDIIKDHESMDYTAIDELLHFLPKKYLIGYIRDLD